jgi:pimeloyl-ACP methyl ester carboxylesterase/class 3 adenylate cyclase
VPVPVDTKYARNGDVSIAYQVVGDGPHTLVGVPPVVSNVEAHWDFPEMVSWITKLTRFSKFIHFDKRGQGLSDRDVGVPTLEVRIDDMLAVLDAEGIEQAHIGGVSEGGTTALLFAATYPERVSSLVLFGTFCRLVNTDDYDVGVNLEVFEPLMDLWVDKWGTPETITLPVFVPSMAGDPEFASRLARYERQSSTPLGLRAQLQWVVDTDLRGVLSAIQCPTLILHRRNDTPVPVAHGRYLAAHIPGAKYVELDGQDHLPYFGDQDSVLDEIEEFITGTRHTADVERVLATVLFTDIVGSTEQAASVGDRKWRDLLDRHDALARTEIERHRGRLVKSTGDGLLATFDGPARGVRCASTLARTMRSLGIDIRAGLHTGEIELRGDDVGGIGVHIGARVAAKAGAGEVLVSRTVKDLVSGSGLAFTDRGVHTLKGVPDDWQLYAVN